MSAEKKALACALVTLLETHGSAAVLSSLAEACDCAHDYDDDTRGLYAEAARHIRSAAKQIKAAEEFETDVPTTLAMGMDLLFQGYE